MGIPLTLSSVPNQNPYVQYVSAGGQTTFPYPFAITQDSDLIVVVNGVTLATDSGYSLTGQGNPTGGNVVFTSGQTLNTIITIYRNIAIQRISQIAQNSGFSSTVFNAEFTNIYLLLQQLESQIGECLQVPNTNNPAPTTTLTPLAYANKYLAFDSNGNPTPAVLTSSGTLTASIIAALTAVFTSAPVIASNAKTALETAAGVSPVDYSYPPYDVRRYGAKGDGSTDDTTAFTNAGSIAHTITVPETGNTYVLSSQVAGCFVAVGQPRFSTTFGRIGIVDEVGIVMQENNGGVIGAFPGPASMVLIGDSITQGAGASAYQNSYAWLFARSVMNHCREGIFQDSGFEYHSLLDFSKLGQTPGVTGTGTIASAGIWNTRYQMTSGQNLNFTQRECRAISVIYNANGVAGTFVVQLNGVTVSTVVVSGSAGLTETGFTVLKANNIMTRLGDTITVACTSGTVQLAAVILAKNSNANALVMHVGGQTGYAYQDYTGGTQISELAFYLNSTATLGGGQSKVLICQLGTNNIYNASKSLTPAATVTQIASLISQLTAVCSNLNVVISIPYKANETSFPVINGSYKYEDYVRAIVAYAIQNNLTLIRNDRNAMGTQQYLSDGLHPTNVGHTMMAATLCKTLGIKYDKFFKSVDYVSADYITQLRTDGVVTMNSTWAASAGDPTNFAARAHLVAGVVYLSGVVAPNGSVATTIGTVPAAMIPDAQDRYFIVMTNVSGGTLTARRVAIRKTSGHIDIDTVPTNDVSLDGISYPVNKFIEA